MNKNKKPERNSIIISIVIFLVLFNVFQILTGTTQGSSEWKQSSSNDFVHGTLNNVQINGSGDLARLELIYNYGWHEKPHMKMPINRSYHAMAAIDGTDMILLYGGWNDTHDCTDTWVYDSVKDKWINMDPVTNPGERLHHKMATIFSTDKVLLFGGWEDARTWVYDYSDNTWTDMNPPSPKPMMRQDHSLAPIWGTDKVLLSCGDGWGLNFIRDTWLYDFTANNWTELSIPPLFKERAYHAMAPVWGTDKVVLVGGLIHTGHDYATWVFDLSESNWTEVAIHEESGSHRYHSLSMIFGTHKVALFGGYYDGKCTNDLLIYDLDTNQWTNQDLSKKPLVREGYGIASVHNTDKFVLFGGENGICYFADTWIYKHSLEYENGTYISKPFNTGTNSSFIQIILDCEIPGETNIQIQLRTGANLTDLEQKSFLGPDGKTDTYYSLNNISIWSGHNGDHMIQAKIHLTTKHSKKTPRINEINIVYNKWPVVYLEAPHDNLESSDNIPVFEWWVSDDSDHQAAFELVIDDDANFGSIDYKSDITQSTQPKWNFRSGINYVNLPDGDWYWKVRTKDNEGAWGGFSEPFNLTIDTTPPRSWITAPENNGSYRFIDVMTGTVSNINNGTDIIKVEIMIKRLKDNYTWSENGWSGGETWLPTALVSDWFFDPVSINWLEGKNYLVRSRAIDKVGNVEDPPNDVIFFIDNEKPITFIEYPKRYWQNNLSKISGTAIDGSGAGIENVIISIKRKDDTYYWTGTTWDFEPVWLNTNGTSNWSYNTSQIVWENGEVYTINSRAMDRSGNKEIPGSTFEFNIDNKPPINSVITIFENTNFTKSNSIALDLEAEDKLSGVFQMAFKINNDSWGEWEKFSTLLLFELPKFDRRYILFFKVRDHALNEGEVVFDTIILDSEPPYNLSLSLQNGSFEQLYPKLILFLNAKDNTTGLANMSFSIDNLNWIPWINYTTSYEYLLPSVDGLYTLYFRVTDHAGNIAEPVNISILLNTSKQKEDDNGKKDTDSNDPQETFSSVPIIWLAILTILIIILLAIGSNVYFKRKERVSKEQELLSRPAVVKRSNVPKKVADAQLVVDKLKKNQ